jgi:choline dehydrogenase-like flavoprotein
MDRWSDTRFDAIVIGTGPGGAAMARELTNQGKRVLILERGPNAPIKGNLLQCARWLLVPGQSLFITADFASVVRGLLAGGSSVFAYATAFEPNYAAFEAHGVDLRPYVEQAREELPLAPLSDELVGPAAWRVLASAQDLGLPWSKLPKLAYQDKCRPECDKCQYGCPYGAKWTSRVLLDEACAAGAVLLAGAHVRSLDVDGDEVRAVHFTMGGATHRASADVIILAAGGIGTPVLLRAAGIHEAGTGLFVDPILILNGSVPDLRGGREFPMATGMYDAEAGYVLTDLLLPFDVYSIFSSIALRPDRIGAHRRTLAVMIKIRDEVGGRIAAGGWINKRLTEADHKRFARGREVAHRILKNAGAEHIFAMPLLASHPGGTARIGEVVDSDLRTRFTNLYVCDASVIPSTWGLPPILTILALGKRLARHLAWAN